MSCEKVSCVRVNVNSVQLCKMRSGNGLEDGRLMLPCHLH